MAKRYRLKLWSSVHVQRRTWGVFPVSTGGKVSLVPIIIATDPGRALDALCRKLAGGPWKKPRRTLIEGRWPGERAYGDKLGDMLAQVRRNPRGFDH